MNKIFFFWFSLYSFIVSFSFYSPNPENDGKKVQEFFTTMEAAIRDHPVWTGATDEEVDCAMEVIISLTSRDTICLYLVVC